MALYADRIYRYMLMRVADPDLAAAAELRGLKMLEEQWGRVQATLVATTARQKCKPQFSFKKPWAMAYCTSSARLCKPSLVIILARWLSTVRTLTTRSSAIC
jgi:hypothetical protein